MIVVFQFALQRYNIFLRYANLMLHFKKKKMRANKFCTTFGTPLPLRGGFSATSLCRLVLTQFSLRNYIRTVVPITTISP